MFLTIFTTPNQISIVDFLVGGLYIALVAACKGYSHLNFQQIVPLLGPSPSDADVNIALCCAGTLGVAHFLHGLSPMSMTLSQFAAAANAFLVAPIAWLLYVNAFASCATFEALPTLQLKVAAVCLAVGVVVVPSIFTTFYDNRKSGKIVTTSAYLEERRSLLPPRSSVSRERSAEAAAAAQEEKAKPAARSKSSSKRRKW